MCPGRGRKEPRPFRPAPRPSASVVLAHLEGDGGRALVEDRAAEVAHLDRPGARVWETAQVDRRRPVHEGDRGRPTATEGDGDLTGRRDPVVTGDRDLQADPVTH